MKNIIIFTFILFMFSCGTEPCLVFDEAMLKEWDRQVEKKVQECNDVEVAGRVRWMRGHIRKDSIRQKFLPTLNMLLRTFKSCKVDMIEIYDTPGKHYTFLLRFSNVEQFYVYHYENGEFRQEIIDKTTPNNAWEDMQDSFETISICRENKNGDIHSAFIISSFSK